MFLEPIYQNNSTFTKLSNAKMMRRPVRIDLTKNSRLAKLVKHYTKRDA